MPCKVWWVQLYWFILNKWTWYMRLHSWAPTSQVSMYQIFSLRHDVHDKCILPPPPLPLPVAARERGNKGTIPAIAMLQITAHPAWRTSSDFLWFFIAFTTWAMPPISITIAHIASVWDVGGCVHEGSEVCVWGMGEFVAQSYRLQLNQTDINHALIEEELDLNSHVFIMGTAHVGINVHSLNVKSLMPHMVVVAFPFLLRLFLSVPYCWFWMML